MSIAGAWLGVGVGLGVPGYGADRLILGTPAPAPNHVTNRERDYGR